MTSLTEPLPSPSALLRLDRETGHLKERRYQVSIVAGPDTGLSRAIEGSIIVGSHAGANIALQDQTVSRNHVELTARPEGVRVRDLDSTNGTYLGGNRISEILVEDEATLSLGKTTLQISMVEADLGTPAAQASFGAAIGASPAMKQLFGILNRVAMSESTVLLLGETGTGKEVLAKAIHDKSLRANKPFVIVDCGAVAPTLIESELFGHTRGAFTGAVADRNGAFLEADGGTVFLDEIGELPIELQPKLLRVLEGGTVRRVGEDRQRAVNIRVIAATHRNLEAEVNAGRFRRDLYYRLAVVLVNVPPMRDRLEDIPLLTAHFVKAMGRGDFQLPRALMARFATYHWPGNVRELRNLVERSLAGAEVELVQQEPSPQGRQPSQATDLTELPFKEAKDRLVDSFTKEYLAAMLEKCGGNISQLAREAGIARNYVHRLVTKYGLKASDDKV